MKKSNKKKVVAKPLFTKPTPVQEIANKMKADGFAYKLTDDGLLYIPRKKALPDHGFEEDQFLITAVLHEKGVWGFHMQAKIRKIEAEGLYSEDNAKVLLTAIKEQMEKEFKYLDDDNGIEVHWDMDLDTTSPFSKGARCGEVVCAFKVTGTVDEVYTFIQQLTSFPEFELIEAGEIKDDATQA